MTTREAITWKSYMSGFVYNCSDFKNGEVARVSMNVNELLKYVINYNACVGVLFVM